MVVVGAAQVTSCAAVYPEMTTAVRSPAPGQELEPPPPEDHFYIRIDKAWVPPKMVGGQSWPGGVPDPFAKLIVNEKEILRTSVESNSREPIWKDHVGQNYRIALGSDVFVEVWDDNAMTNLPICRARVRDISNMRAGGSSEIWCDSGARVWLTVKPARALVGLGLYYELRGRNEVRVTRVLGGSPAERAGLSAGDRILGIAGKPVSSMDGLQVRSEINLNSRSGVELDVWFQSGKRHIITIQEGAIYPLSGDDIELPSDAT